MTAPPAALPFGTLLLQARKAAGLTQEELAERAHLSKRGISDLERGTRLTPRKDTLALLVQALELAGDDRAGFEHAAGHHGSPGRQGAASTEPGRHSPAPAPAWPTGCYLGARPPHAIVARELELAAISQALQASLGGEGTMLMLEGEPGVGKTRLAQEAMLQAGQAGMVTLVGRCYEEQRAAPYHPFLELLGSAWQAAPEALRAEAGLRYAELGRLLPSLLEAPPLMQDEQAHYRLTGAVAGFLGALAARRPLALLLDDLHWADSASLGLMEQLARRLHGAPVFILGAYRDVAVSRQHPLENLLGTLARERLAGIITVRRLDARGTAALLADRLRLPASPEGLSALVHQRSEGNPFFAEELLAALSEQRTGQDWQEARELEAAGLDLPRSVRAVIGRRISGLPEPAQDLLRAASVVGQDFALPVLLQVAGQAEEQVYAGLEAALRHRIVEERAGGRSERYIFTHALIAQTLYEEVPGFRRRRLHLRVAEALVQAHGEQPEQAAGIAHHCLAGGDEERAAGYLERAGDYAVSVDAHDEAIGHYRTAAELLGEAGQPVRAAKARSKLGDQLRLMLRLGEASQALTQALAVLEGAGEPEALAMAHCHMALLHSWQLENKTGWPHILRALEVWPAGRVSADLVRILINASLAAAYTGHEEEAPALMERAQLAAEQVGDDAAKARVLALSLDLQVFRGGTLGQLADLYGEALRLARQTHSVSLEARIGVSMGILYGARGEFARAEAKLAAAGTRAHRGCSPSDELNALDNQLACLLFMGCWQQTRLVDKRMSALQFQCSYPQFSFWARGEFGQALQASRTQIAGARGAGGEANLLCGLAFAGHALLQLGQAREAEEAAREAEALMRKTGLWGDGWIVSGTLAEAAALSHAPDAWEVLREAEQVMGRYELYALRPELLRARGLLLRRQGRLDEALQALLAGAAAAREQASHAQLARTLLVLSALARQMGQEQLAFEADEERKAVVLAIGPGPGGLAWAALPCWSPASKTEDMR